MNRDIRILVQTTTPGEEDGWSIDRLSLLREHLAGIREDGLSVSVTARNRPGPPGEPDLVLSRLDEAPFDELWLFALDTGEGLAVEDCEGITRFRQRRGGILATRDHQDMGSSLCSLGGIEIPPRREASAGRDDARACSSSEGTPTAPSCGWAGKRSIRPVGDPGWRSSSCGGLVGRMLWKSPLRPEW